MAKTKRRRYSRSNGGGGKLSVAIVAGLIPGVSWSLQPAASGNWPHAMERGLAAYTGYYIPEKRFRLDFLAYGLFPLLLGFLVHNVASRTGINRALGKMLPLGLGL